MKKFYLVGKKKYDSDVVTDTALISANDRDDAKVTYFNLMNEEGKGIREGDMVEIVIASEFCKFKDDDVIGVESVSYSTLNLRTRPEFKQDFKQAEEREILNKQNGQNNKKHAVCAEKLETITVRNLFHDKIIELIAHTLFSPELPVNGSFIGVEKQGSPVCNSLYLVKGNKEITENGFYGCEILARTFYQNVGNTPYEKGGKTIVGYWMSSRIIRRSEELQDISIGRYFRIIGKEKIYRIVAIVLEDDVNAINQLLDTIPEQLSPFGTNTFTGKDLLMIFLKAFITKNLPTELSTKEFDSMIIESYDIMKLLHDSSNAIIDPSKL